MWSVISDPNGGYVQGINQGNAQGTIQLQDTNMTMQNINTMQGIAQSSVQGLVQQQQQQNVGNMQQQQHQQPQIVGSVQDTTQGLMGNAQGIVPLQIGNMQGMTQGNLGNVQGTIQNMGTGLIQQQGYGQGIQIGQSLANTTYAQGNPQIAGAGAGMGDQQLFQQIKQMSVNNPMLLIALQELEKRMLTNMTPVQNMTGVSPGYNCQGLMYSNVQTQGIQQMQPQGIQVPPQGMCQFQQLGQYQVQTLGQQMVQPQIIPQVPIQGIQPVINQGTLLGQNQVMSQCQNQIQQPGQFQVQSQVQQVGQAVVQPPLQQPAVQQSVHQPMQQSVVQQPLQQYVGQQPVQPAVQLPVQPLVVQQPVQQPTVQQPVLQSLVQQPMQQPVMQQSAVQPIVQQYVQQPVPQPMVQQVMQPETVVQQPLVQPVVQQQMQQPSVSNQGILQEQNKVISQNQYQGILQVCNQGIPHVPNQGTLPCSNQGLQPNQSQGLQPSENQVTLQCLNQDLQLGSQNVAMRPVQGYLGMALKVLNKGNYQPSQLQQGDPGVQLHMPDVCQPNADHSKLQLEEGNQTNKLCGQHMTEVGSQPDDQGQISQHDNTHLMQVIDSHTLQKSWPELDSEMLLMTEVPAQTWLPLLPSLPPQNNEDQSLPVQSTGPSPQDSDYQFIHGEVSRDNENATSLVPPTINKVESSNDTECLGGQYMADSLGKTSDAGIQMLGPQLVNDRQKSSQNHDTNGQVIINPFIPAVNKDVVPCTNNHQELSDQMPVTRFYQKSFNADKNEDEMHDFSTVPSSSTISTYSDMYRAMTMIMHDTSTYPTLMPFERRDGCHEHLLRDMDQQHPIFNYIRQRRGYTSDDQLNQPEWQWCNAVLQNCAQLRPGVHQICLMTETKYKPPGRCSSDIIITAVGRQRVYGQQTVSLVDETTYKQPDTVQEEDKWHWCDGVPWSLTHDSHSTGNQDDSPCQQYLEVETKFRPPDATHQIYM